MVGALRWPTRPLIPTDTAFLSVKAWEMTWDSFQFGDTSPGLMAVPFWIPQVAMVIGLLGLTIAFVDEFVEVWNGKDPNFKDVEQLEVEQALAVKVPGEPEPESARPLVGAR